MNDQPLLTIITVVKNAAALLEKTLLSVREKAPQAEYIIVDGGSVDDTCNVIRRYQESVSSWVSESDGGIYEAMNKGISMSHGKYLLFLNAGDLLACSLEEIALPLREDCALVYGRAAMREEDGTLRYIKGKALSSHRKLLKGMRLCHQAVFFRRDLLDRFDTGYRIIADRVAIYGIMKRWGASSCRFIPSIICDYVEGGYSAQNRSLARQEEIRFLVRERCRLLVVWKWLGRGWSRFVSSSSG